MMAEYQEGGEVPCYRCTGLRKDGDRYVCTLPGRWDKDRRSKGDVDIHDVPMLAIGMRGCGNGYPKTLE